MINFFKNEKVLYLVGVIICISLISAIFLVSPIQQIKAADKIMPEDQNILEVFNRVPLDDETMVKQIVLADEYIQELIEDKEYDFNVYGHQITGQDWHLALGVTLKEGTDVNEWLKQGKSDKSVIEEYVGVLNIGYNDGYKMSIDVKNEKIDKLTYFPRKVNPIQELTLSEKKNIVEIVLNDPRIKELLQDKDYTLAPEGVNIWVGEGKRTIGGTICIWLDCAYEIEYDWPYPDFDTEKYTAFPNYAEKSINRILDVKALFVMVDLGKQKVVGISERPINEHTKDLYKP